MLKFSRIHPPRSLWCCPCLREEGYKFQGGCFVQFKIHYQQGIKGLQNKVQDPWRQSLRSSWPLSVEHSSLSYQALKTFLFPLAFAQWNNRPLAVRDHLTNASFKQWVGILMMPKIDRADNNYLTSKI